MESLSSDDQCFTLQEQSATKLKQRCILQSFLSKSFLESNVPSVGSQQRRGGIQSDWATLFLRFTNSAFLGSAEARRVKQAAERKSDGAAKVGALEQTARLFQNALLMSLTLPVQEEALFDLVWIYSIYRITDGRFLFHVLSARLRILDLGFTVRL